VAGKCAVGIEATAEFVGHCARDRLGIDAGHLQLDPDPARLSFGRFHPR